MRALIFICVACVAVMLSGHVDAAPFRNLNFEETTGTATGVPYWTIPPGIDYLFNATFAGEGSLTLFNSDFSSPWPPVSVLEGQQSLLFAYDPTGSDPPTGGALFQTGDIPASATVLTMLTTNLDGIRVRINGTVIPLSILEIDGSIQRVAGNISVFSGTTATLLIESPFGTEDHLHSIVVTCPKFLVQML